MRTPASLRHRQPHANSLHRLPLDRGRVHATVVCLAPALEDEVLDVHRRRESQRLQQVTDEPALLSAIDGPVAAQE